MLCNKCGFEGSPNLEETGPHTKATCQKCGAYIKMVGKKELEALIDNVVTKGSGYYKYATTIDGV